MGVGVGVGVGVSMVWWECVCMADACPFVVAV